MGQDHFELFCDRLLSESAIQEILDSDNTIEIVSHRVREAKRIEDTTIVHVLKRGDGLVRVLQTGPYDGEYWMTVILESDNSHTGFELAKYVREVLVACGASDDDQRGNSGGAPQFLASKGRKGARRR